MADGGLQKPDQNYSTDMKEADIDTCALSPENLLHAGTTLKNTDYVYAVCVYGGAETKVKMFYYED